MRIRQRTAPQAPKTETASKSRNALQAQRTALKRMAGVPCIRGLEGAHEPEPTQGAGGTTRRHSRAAENGFIRRKVAVNEDRSCATVGGRSSQIRQDDWIAEGRRHCPRRGALRGQDAASTGGQRRSRGNEPLYRPARCP